MGKTMELLDLSVAGFKEDANGFNFYGRRCYVVAPSRRISNHNLVADLLDGLNYSIVARHRWVLVGSNEDAPLLMLLHHCRISKSEKMEI
ncbi:hypothetical protein ACLOJK_015203 [Asimina triloba]